MSANLSFTRINRHTLFLCLASVVLFIILGAIMPVRFIDVGNFSSMAVQLSTLGLFSIAMTLSLMIAGIDLSIVAVANLAAILSGLTLHALVPEGATTSQLMTGFVASVAVALIVGAVVGLVNGFLVARVGVPSILATLATMTLISGLSLGITNGSAVNRLPAPLVSAANASVLWVPVPFVLFLFVWVLADVMLRRTALGSDLKLIGTNLKVAQFAGVRTEARIITTHLICSLIAASAGYMSLLRTNSANAEFGGAYVLLALLVAAFGGISVNGGAGRMSGVLFALIFLQFLSTGFNMLLLGVSDGNFFSDLVWGLLLVAIMVFSGMKKRR